MFVQQNIIWTVLPLIVSGVTIALVYDVRMLSMGNQLQGSIIWTLQIGQWWFTIIGLIVCHVFLPCQVIVDTPIEIMRNCYGSHVLRTLLCLCKGVSLDSPELHKTKSSTILAQQLNSRPARVEMNDSQYLQQGFPDQLKFLVSGILNCSKEDILTLQTDQCSSLVLQVFFL